MGNKGFYNTNATYKQAVNALGTTICEWNIHDTETHKNKLVSNLLHTPEKVTIHKDWSEQIKKMDEVDSEKLGYKLWDVKKVIFNYLYESMGDFVKRGRPEENNDLCTDIYVDLANYYADMTEELKNVLRFGYIITESLSMMVVTGGIIPDGGNDEDLSMLGMAINWTLNHREFRTGKLIDINNVYMMEDSAKKYIAENDLDKVDTVPLTRDCFMTNISELIEKPFYVTPNFFEMVKLDYAKSEELPHTFCKLWFEDNDLELSEDNILLIDGISYAYCTTDDDILGTYEDVQVMDVIDSLAKDVQTYRETVSKLAEEYKKLEEVIKETKEMLK